MQQENILFITNIYAPNIKALKYKKQILTDLKRETDSSTVIRGTLTPYSDQQLEYPDRKSIRKHRSSMKH